MLVTKKYKVKKKKLGAHKPKAQTAGVYPKFLNIKHA